MSESETMLLDPAIVETALGEALRRGGEWAEVFVEERRSTGISLDDKKVEQLASGRDRGAGIRVVVGDTTGFAHTADLSEKGLLVAVEAAASVARGGGGGARAVALEGREVTSASHVEIAPESVPKADKVDLLRRADATARAAGSSIVQVSANYADGRRRILVANTDGTLVEDDQVRTRFLVYCVASGDAGLQTGYEIKALTMGFELFEREDVEEMARRASALAITKLAARPAPSGVVPVVLKRGSGGYLFHEACGHGLEADLVAKQASIFRGRIGEQVASPLVTLVDDGTVGDEWGTTAIDDEGHSTQRNVLIENGVLTSYMWDFLRTRKEGRASSSGNGRRQSYQHLPMVRMTNTFLLPGSEDPDEIVAQTKHGVYIAKLGGGQVNTSTGDFVFGTTEAYLIEDGRITEPLRDANLIGNGPDILSKIDAVGNDFDMTSGTCGKDGQSVPVGSGQPTLRVSGITIGGTADA